MQNGSADRTKPARHICEVRIGTSKLKGIALIDKLPKEVETCAMQGYWEQPLIKEKQPLVGLLAGKTP